MQIYTVLKEKSLNLDIELYQLKPNMCYNNVFNFISLNSYKNKYEVCYGYLKINNSNEKILIRHAFLIDIKEKKILDPTLQFLGDSENKYYIFKRFKNFNEYIDLLEKEKYPALYNGLIKEQLKFQKEITNNLNISNKNIYEKYPMDIIII